MISVSRSLKNLLFVFFGRIAGQIFGFIIGVILARYLGPADYGKYSFTTSFCFIFMVISDFGLDDLYVRDIAADPTRVSKYLGASFIIKPIMAFVSLILLYTFLCQLNYPSDIVISTMIFSSYIFFITQTNTINAIFCAFEKMEYVAIIAIINGAVGLLLILIVVYLEQSLNHVFLVRILTFGLVGLISLLILSNKIAKPDFGLDFLFLKNILRQSFPFLTICILNTLYFQVDIIMLSKMKGTLYVGYYAPAANDLFFGLFFIPGAISTVVYPIFSRQFHQSIDKLRDTINLTIKVLTILGSAISVGTFILSPQLIYFIFGIDYYNSIIILRIMALAIVFAFIREPLGFALASIGKQVILMWMNLFFLMLNIVLNLILIPIYAHVGAAIATLVCIALSLFLGYYVLKKEVLGISLFRGTLKIFLNTLIMGVVVYLLRDFNVIFTIGVGALVYGLLILLLKTFNETELSVIMSMVKRK